MSIKSLFEDIADAIREKSGSGDTYTPAEMPSAIRSIPSGSSTASGVSYDNTSSGLTASNVQDAIDELSGDVSTINSDLSELSESNFGTSITITSYTSADNPYVFPSDGYLILYALPNSVVHVKINNATEAITAGTTSNYQVQHIYVRKDMRVQVISASASSVVLFVPFAS